MHIYVNGRNLEITDAIKAYVKEKIGKVANHYDQITGIDVVLTVVKNPAASGKHVAEVTCKLNSGMIHVKEEASSMYESIDLLADKLARQVKKYKERSLDQERDSIRTEDYSVADDEDDDEEEIEAENEE